MFANFAINFLIIVGIAFIIRESFVHKSYKKDLEKEKLISFFSNARMQLMKMLYMKEITPNSSYFNFMIRATSCSIRTIYYNKKDLSIDYLDCIQKTMSYLDKDNLKQEFENLNSEQKELFAKTALNILNLYFEDKILRKLLWKLYILKFSAKILRSFIAILENIQTTKTSSDLQYLDNVEKSYNLRQYACA